MVAGGGMVVHAQEATRHDSASPPKSRYTLFHPTPPDRLRELSTDRPDQTESPYTVDAGHVQVEMDLVNAARDVDRSDGGNVRATLWGVAPLNVKLGLLNNVDVQVVLDTYMRSHTRDGKSGIADTMSGFGDLTTRLKVNFWGNDRGRTAFGVMPFVKWPLSRSDLRNGRTEAGVIFPFAADVGGGWGFGAMTEVDVVAGEAGGHDMEFVNSITLGHDVARKLGTYVEFVAVTGSAPGFRRQMQADVGLTFGWRENVQFDVGCNFGANESAFDLNPFSGLSVRF